MVSEYPSDAIFTGLGLDQIEAGRDVRRYEGQIDGLSVKVHYQRIYQNQQRYAHQRRQYDKSSLRIYIDSPTILTRFQVGPYARAFSKMKKVDLSHDPAYEGRVVMGLDHNWAEQVAVDARTRDPLLRLTRRHETTGTTGAIQIQPGTVMLFTDLHESHLSEDYARSYVDDMVELVKGIVSLPATYTPVKATAAEKTVGASGPKRWILAGIALTLIVGMGLCFGLLALGLIFGG